MADPPTTPPFPFDDALCEQCGYPLKGLAFEAECPECGYAVAESLPDKRVGMPVNTGRGSARRFYKVQRELIFSPRLFFRKLCVQQANKRHKRYRFASVVIASALWSVLMLVGMIWFDHARVDFQLVASQAISFVVVVLGLMLLTYIEMIGVTAFSKRRGWRVPFHLAERVCCYASVGWIPGVMIATTGYWVLQVHAADQLWFDRPLGLVRVRWICYAGLFVLSFLWFETLVWIGVRQVRFANAWPACAPKPDPADDTP